jgi:hypothetical protein
VAFCVIQFLNNQGYSESDIFELRKRLGTRRTSGRFSIEEIQECVITESAYFLELFLERVRLSFRPFLRSLEEANRFSLIFPKYESAAELIGKVEKRQVFHCMFECDWMRKDYEDGSRQLPNSGVFAEPEIKRAHYLVRREYLEKLGMRACSVCQGQASSGEVMTF